MSATNNTLVIDALRAVDAVPNSLDRNVLLLIQENIAVDVMKMYRDDLKRLMDRQKAAGMPAAQAVEERKQFFADRLNVEYRNRAGAGAEFSLPLYLETASNHYRMEIRRHLQVVQDYVAQGRFVSEIHFVNNVREMRVLDPKLHDLAQKVATGLNSINDSLERLARIGRDTATRMAKDIRTEFAKEMKDVQADNFSSAMLNEAQTLAEAQRELKRIEDDNKPALRH